MIQQIINLIGAVNTDGTQLTIAPEGSIIVFENPWTISGNKINGSIQDFIPTPPDTIIVKRRYEFTKQ